MFINDDLIIQRVQKGIQLVSQEEKSLTNKGLPVNEMDKFPFHVYFMSYESACVKVNEQTAKSFNLESPSEAIGKTVFDLATEPYASFCRRQDQKTMKTGVLSMDDGLVTRLDGFSFPIVDIKFPWIDNHDQILGIFGFSVHADQSLGHSLANSMMLLAETGLLQLEPEPKQITRKDTVYFTKRQKEILYHLIRGKTAKMIAAILGLSTRTVEHHLDNMKVRTDSMSKSELIEKAISQFNLMNG